MLIIPWDLKVSFLPSLSWHNKIKSISWTYAEALDWRFYQICIYSDKAKLVFCKVEFSQSDKIQMCAKFQQMRIAIEKF